MKAVVSKAKEFQKQVRTQIGISLAAAFAFVIALSWNDFIKEEVNQLLASIGLDGKVVYARLAAVLLITIVCIIGISLASRLGKKDA
jgi:TRAP-type C4-dicarboxylate transport system permease small subunit